MKMSIDGLCPVQEIDPSSKIKLQLFPIDDVTRAGLEKAGHHPYLELILRARKKISSVLKHIKGKWGSSSIARGEPVLFPYYTPTEKAASYSWTVNDSEVSAGEVYAAIGCPAIFRLRYGWSSNYETTTCPLGSKLASAASGLILPNSAGTCSQTGEPQKCTGEEMIDVHEEEQKQTLMQESVVESSKEMQVPGNEKILPCQPENHTGPEERGNEAQGQSAAFWADSLTNISIGGLLSEASLLGKIDNFELKTNGRSRQPSALISDSLDAFIAANTNYSQSPMLPPSEPRSSILDAEDTCHAFSFKRPSSSSSSRDFQTSSGYIGVCHQESVPKASKLPQTTKGYNDESSLGLAGINWTDTLGPFDLGLPSRKIINGDSISLGGLAR
ncbi:hypothetical protein CRG98_017415 [Punica granatum]|uniref:TSL-kinase interacting protein 1 n=1 Tax=Punica granatum TaxID=22663 RepID=A0A2I0K0G9_PUNGR|nr:hypothetical protein CRG98_017415 [Punica granatum]